jgi:formiminotetrahydrofolate cyclodeaminase
VPAKAIAVAEQVLSLAEQLLPIGNRNVVSDVAAAAEAARAAATTARVNVEINLGGIKDPANWGELASVVDTVDDLVLRAEKVTAAVRDGLVR